MNRVVPLLILGCMAALLVACSARREAPVQPPPLVHAQAPDTSSMGSGPGSGILGGAGAMNCSRSTAEILQRINAARAAGYRCGGRPMRPAHPLKWEAALYNAASGHSLDMAKRNYFEHRSPEGADVASRASAVQYDWKSVGENLAAGDRTIDEAVQGWLDSPAHCENMLDPRFVDVAVACVAQPGTEWGTYWTMVLGRKR